MLGEDAESCQDSASGQSETFPLTGTLALITPPRVLTKDYFRHI